MVTVNQLVRSHRGAVKTMQSLSTAFGDNPLIRFRFLNNSCDGVEFRRGIREIPPQDYN
jgi:hypothetical protein